MATQAKLTIKRGQTSANVTLGAGTTISGSNAMELNIDWTAITQREAAVMLDELKKYILQRPWPLT